MRKCRAVLSGLRHDGSTREHRTEARNLNTRDISSVTVTSCLALWQLLFHVLVSHFPHLQNRNNDINSSPNKGYSEDQVWWHLIVLENCIACHAYITSHSHHLWFSSPLPSFFLGHLKFIPKGHLEDFILILKMNLTYLKRNGNWSSTVKYTCFLINLSRAQNYIYTCNYFHFGIL